MAKIYLRMRAFALILARPGLLFYALPWLMLLLVLGTVAQRYIGLYQSQKLFFGSFVLWIGEIPVPGAYSALGLIALALCLKLLLKSPIRKHSIGIVIAHVSILVLLVGGLLSALYREEGYMVLGDNDTSHTISDYHYRELAIIRNGKLLEAIPHDDLYKGLVIRNAALPFTVTISNYCYNCTMAMHGNADPAVHGMAARFSIDNTLPEKEDAKNQSGVTFVVAGAPAEENGTYLAFQALNQQPELTIGKDKYQIVMRQSERGLPFDIRLLHFEKTEYPGTNVARSYRSTVEVKDGLLKWNTVIEMNQPLRYRGYTLYQSSFIENDKKLFTVLAVVKNSGAWFPYIAITVLCIGLIVHLVTVTARKRAA